MVRAWLIIICIVGMLICSCSCKENTGDYDDLPESLQEDLYEVRKQNEKDQDELRDWLESN